MLQLKLYMPQNLIIFEFFGFFRIFFGFWNFSEFFEIFRFSNSSKFFRIFRKVVRFARPPEDYSPIVLRAPNIFLCWVLHPNY